MATFGLWGEADLSPLREYAFGLEALGHRVVWRNYQAWSGDHERFDAVVIFGARAQGADIAKHYDKKGAPVVVIDHGYLRRVFLLSDYGHGHFQVGMRRLGWVPDQAPSGERLAALGVEIGARERRPIRRALILGQVPFDGSHHLSQPQLREVYAKLARELREAGCERVTYRAHPLAPEAWDVDGVEADGIRSLAAAVADADVVASLNSNAGLDAIIAGCPAIVLRPSHYTELAYRWPVLLSVIEPPQPERTRRLLERLAYAQWTAAEMARGEPQRFLAAIGATP